MHLTNATLVYTPNYLPNFQPALALLVNRPEAAPVQTRFHYFFDWDPGKAASNFRKHKVTFEQA